MKCLYTKEFVLCDNVNKVNNAVIFNQQYDTMHRFYQDKACKNINGASLVANIS